MANKYKEMASVGLSKANTKTSSMSGVKNTIKKIDYRNKGISNDLEDVVWLSHLKNKKTQLKKEKYDSILSDPMFSKLKILAPDSYKAYSKGTMFEYGEGDNKTFMGIDDISNMIAVSKYFSGKRPNNKINEILGNAMMEEGDE